jgi:hypothetical protein
VLRLIIKYACHAMQHLKLFKLFYCCLGENALSWEVLNLSENQGITNEPPLGWILSPRFRQIGEDIGELCLQFIFFFPSSFFLGMITPLHFAYLIPIIPGDFLLGV